MGQGISLDVLAVRSKRKNGSSGSGWLRIGAEVKRCFKSLNGCCTSSDN